MPTEEERLLAEMGSFEGIHRLLECDICHASGRFTISLPMDNYSYGAEICEPCIRPLAARLAAAEHALGPLSAKVLSIQRVEGDSK